MAFKSYLTSASQARKNIVRVTNFIKNKIYLATNRKHIFEVKHLMNSMNKRRKLGFFCIFLIWNAPEILGNVFFEIWVYLYRLVCFSFVTCLLYFKLYIFSSYHSLHKKFLYWEKIRTRSNSVLGHFSSSEPYG